MTPCLRQFALPAHVTFSVGWLGAVVAYLALAIAGLISDDVPMVRAAYLLGSNAMGLALLFVVLHLTGGGPRGH